jgi:hypothetical protein
MAKSPLFLRFFLFCFGEKKNLSPDFGVIVYFFGLGRFSIYRVVGLLKSSFDKRPLNVGLHVEINLKLIHMALGKIPRELGAM